MKSKAPLAQIATCTAQRSFREFGAALGDLGVFTPHVIGALTVGGLGACGVLFGFGTFFIASGVVFGAPMAVQPMKAVSAALLTGQINPGGVAVAGLAMGAAMLLLGATGAVRVVARIIPQSVATGLQLGLGLWMILLGARMALTEPWLGILTLLVLFAAARFPRLPAVAAALAFAIAAGLAAGSVEPGALHFEWRLPSLAAFSWTDLAPALQSALLPQLPLTLTNAVILTAALCRDLFPAAERAGDERTLALSTGFANLLLAPLGAMPMCHGAGGVQAQHRFGGRSGLGPILFGSFLVVLALGFSESAVALFRMAPESAVGILLAAAGADLALSKRLFDARPGCRPTIAAAAAATLLVDPAVGLLTGWGVEYVRGRILRRRPGRGSGEVKS